MTVEPLRAGDPAAIGAYELLGRLGAGGMGQVFLGRAQGGRMVAVKVVREDLASHAQFRQRFRAEVLAAQRVSGMWTASVLDCDTESDVPWVATEYVAGAPLQTVVESLHGALGEHSVWALAHGLGQALTRIHGVGLIHRDLKPSNVMVSREGPKVIDFGIARAVDASTRLTRTGAMLGTPGYMAPEQISGERLTGAVDVFALGAVLAYAATGLPPFSWDGAGVHTVLYRVMNQPPRLGPEDGPLRGEVRELVVRCLAKEPGERPDLAEILPSAKAGAGTDYWLPSELMARLGQDAAALLPFHGPGQGDPFVAPQGFGPIRPNGPDGSRGTDEEPSPVTPDQTTYVPAETGAPAPSAASPSGVAPAPGVPPRPLEPSRTPWTAWTTRTGRRRNRYLLGAVSAVMALTVGGWLVVKDWGPNSPGEGDGRASGSTRAPLADVVPQKVRDAGGLTVHIADREGRVLVADGEGDPTGFEVDLIKAMGQRLGVDVRFTEHEDDEATAPAAVAKGRDTGAHLAMADLPDTPENRKKWGVDMVDDFRSGLGVISRAEHRSLDEVCGTTVATYADEILQEQIHYQADCERPLDLLLFDHRDEMVHAIQTGKAEAAVVNYPPAVEQIGFVQPDTGLTVSLVNDAQGPRGIAVPSGQTELRKAVVEALEALIEDGTYKRLLARWHLLDAAVDKVRVNGDD